MGGHMSAAATTVTLEHDIAMLHRYSDRAKRLGWHHKNWDVSKVIQGLLHVDDSFVMSKVLCWKCIERGMKMLWPKDIGISTEHKPPCLVFLHLQIELKDCVD
eukprot:5683870-Lingulodinium_polyedra.AAC.1